MISFAQVGRNMNSVTSGKLNGRSNEPSTSLLLLTQNKKTCLGSTVNHSPTHFLFSGQSQVS